LFYAYTTTLFPPQPLLSFVLCLASPAAPRYLHSFPTRRSSDLGIGTFTPIMPTCTSFSNLRAAPPSFVKIAVPLPYGFALMSSRDRKSTRLNSSHVSISYAVFCLTTTPESATTRSPNNSQRRTY